MKQILTVSNIWSYSNITPLYKHEYIYIINKSKIRKEYIKLNISICKKLMTSFFILIATFRFLFNCKSIRYIKELLK